MRQWTCLKVSVNKSTSRCVHDPKAIQLFRDKSLQQIRQLRNSGGSLAGGIADFAEWL